MHKLELTWELYICKVLRVIILHQDQYLHGGKAILVDLIMEVKIDGMHGQLLQEWNKK